MKLKIFSTIVFTILLVSFVFGAEYQLKRATDLIVGDVMVASDGSEIVIEKIEIGEKVKEDFVYQESKSLMEALWGKISEGKITGYVVSGGSSDVGLSLGEMGVGVKVIAGAVDDVETEETLHSDIEEKKSFWDKLFFWRIR